MGAVRFEALYVFAWQGGAKQQKIPPQFVITVGCEQKKRKT
jgi:hypothetical protein